VADLVNRTPSDYDEQARQGGTALGRPQAVPPHPFHTRRSQGRGYTMRSANRKTLPVALAAAAMFFLTTSAAAWAAGSSAQPVTPDRWTRSVCREVSTWMKTRGEVDARYVEILGALSSGSLGAKAAKTRLSRAIEQGVDASDGFTKAVRAAGTPNVDGGTQVARSYRTTLADNADAYKQARNDLARAKTSNREHFAATAQEINSTLTADLAAIGVDPVEELRPVPELAAGISASCADVASYLMAKIDAPCQAVLSTARHLADVDNQQDPAPIDSPELDALLVEEERAFGQLQGEFGGCNIPAIPAPCRKPFEDSQQLASLWNQFFNAPVDSPQEAAAETELNRQYDVLRSDLQVMCR
jgi:hypothetical protein